MSASSKCGAWCKILSALVSIKISITLNKKNAVFFLNEIVSYEALATDHRNFSLIP